jgi:hypothetical protein
MMAEYRTNARLSQTFRLSAVAAAEALVIAYFIANG